MHCDQFARHDKHDKRLSIKRNCTEEWITCNYGRGEYGLWTRLRTVPRACEFSLIIVYEIRTFSLGLRQLQKFQNGHRSPYYVTRATERIYSRGLSRFKIKFIISVLCSYSLRFEWSGVCWFGCYLCKWIIASAKTLFSFTSSSRLGWEVFVDCSRHVKRPQTNKSFLSSSFGNIILYEVDSAYPIFAVEWKLLRCMASLTFRAIQCMKS